jgi:FkbM family methyltransferase
MPGDDVSRIESVRAFLRVLRDRWDPELRRRRREFSTLNRGVSAGEIALRPGVKFSVDPEARESMEYFATRSKEMCRELDAFLLATSGRSRLLDIGALHGVFALSFAASRPRSRGVAVEPSPEARQILRQNLALNPGFAIEVSETALGREPGEIRMRRNWQHFEALGAGESAPDERIVPVQTADELCASRDFEPDVVKLDVEGFEGEILAGAERLLELRPVLLLELHPPVLHRFGTSATRILVDLRRRDYRVEPIGRRSLPDEARLLRHNSIRVLALPASAGGN